MKRSIQFALFSLAWALIQNASLAQDFIDVDDLMEIDELLDDDISSNAEIADPLEGLNRSIFAFNDYVYNNVFSPFTKAYVKAVPQPARKGVDNFFDNLEYPVRLASNVLQFKFQRATYETARFLVNSTAGVAGFMDVAKTDFNLEVPEEDIGQAFGAWGIDHGFYVIIPFIGPSSLRDFVGRFGANVIDPISEPSSQIDDSQDRFALQAVDTVNDLPEIIDLYESITESAIDPYTAVRDGYAQFRARQVSE